MWATRNGHSGGIHFANRCQTLQTRSDSGFKGHFCDPSHLLSFHLSGPRRVWRWCAGTRCYSYVTGRRCRYGDGDHYYNRSGNNLDAALHAKTGNW